MIPLFNIAEINTFKRASILPMKCERCGETFYAKKKEINKALNGHPTVKIKYCSNHCKHNTENNTNEVTCNNCGKNFMKRISEIKKTPNNFCCQSCAATYNNTHKTTGTRRSKLEIWLEIKLIESYPNLKIHFNHKDTINSELDIYIPSLKLAFELNGIFHYEPIYGQDKLNQIQNNDNRKFQACIEHGIELCLIDISSQNYFKENTSIKFLEIIINIINNKSKNVNLGCCG